MAFNRQIKIIYSARNWISSHTNHKADEKEGKKERESIKSVNCIFIAWFSGCLGAIRKTAKTCKCRQASHFFLSLSHSLPFSVSYFLCLSQEYCIKLKSRFDRQLNLPTWLSIWRLLPKSRKKNVKVETGNKTEQSEWKLNENSRKRKRKYDKVELRLSFCTW